MGVSDAERFATRYKLSFGVASESSKGVIQAFSRKCSLLSIRGSILEA